MRGIRGQFIHPGLFETDIADAQVGGAFIQIDQLLGGRVVGFGAASFRNHADYLEFIACNGFCEIAQGLQGDSQGRFVEVDCLLSQAVNRHTISTMQHEQRILLPGCNGENM